MGLRIAVRGGRVVTPSGIRECDVLIEDSRIMGIAVWNAELWGGARTIDARGCYVFPGLIDPHTHIQLDTGIYQTADNWEIGTRTAAFGGVTTVVDFATQFPGMTFHDALDARLNECKPAHDRLWAAYDGDRSPARSG